METMTYVTRGCVPSLRPNFLEVDSKGFGFQIPRASTTALVCARDFSHCQARCRFVSLDAFVEREK